MDPDLFFVLGAIISVFSVPSIVSALTDSRAPRVPALMILIGAGMIAYAMQQRPGAYGIDTLAETFARVVSGFL